VQSARLWHSRITASGTVTESTLVLVDVVTEEGEVGHGLVFTYATAARKSTADSVCRVRQFRSHAFARADFAIT